jgi:serine/threonine protein kinase
MPGKGGVEIGQIVSGNYRIERVLGQGGMATVFAASHVRLPRRVAIKVITADLTESEESSEFQLRFRREAETLAKLEHPNIVTVSDWNVTDSGQPYLVMELLSGEDLSQLLRRVGALPRAMAVQIFAQIAAALTVAHQAGVIHRDIKPSNVFLCQGATNVFVKVLDFGIAKHLLQSASLATQGQALLGTPAYMSPEQARGQNEQIDERTDQFALALVLYEMLSGQPAFYRKGDLPMATLYRVLYEDPPLLEDEELRPVIGRALHKQAAARYPTLAAFTAAVIGESEAPRELSMLQPKPARGSSASALSTLAPALGAHSHHTQSGTRRFGELTPKPQKRTRSLGQRLLSGVGGVVLSVGGVISLGSAHHPDAKSVQSPGIDVRSVRYDPGQKPLAARTQKESEQSRAEPPPQAVSIPMSSSLKRSSIRETSSLPASARSPAPKRPPKALLLESSLPKGSTGESIVLRCLRSARNVSWDRYRGQSLRFHELDGKLHLTTLMEPQPKAELERCVSALLTKVVMLPSIIEVFVK